MRVKTYEIKYFAQQSMRLHRSGRQLSELAHPQIHS